VAFSIIAKEKKNPNTEKVPEPWLKKVTVVQIGKKGNDELAGTRRGRVREKKKKRLTIQEKTASPFLSKDSQAPHSRDGNKAREKKHSLVLR